MNEMTLGKRIMQHRKRLGMTQEQLADRVGVSAQAVSKWENDLSCPDISLLPQLAEILRSIRSGEPAVICDLVLDQVSDSYLGKERDDLTIMTAKLL